MEGFFAELLWAIVFGLLGGIAFVLISAVRRIQQKEEEASKRRTETTISLFDGCLAVFVPIIIACPVLIFFLSLFAEDRSGVWLIISLIIALFTASIIALWYAEGLKIGNEESDGYDSSHLSQKGKNGLDTGTKTMMSLMGAEMLNKQLNKEREEREKRRHESLFWQEDIRDKMKDNK